MSAIYDIELTGIDKSSFTLKAYEGKVILLVNVASKCGLTPQYEGLQTLYQKYADDGLVIVGLPCNQFLGQEPGTEEDIKSFCDINYQVTFPMTAKLEVNGEGRHSLYTFLSGEEALFPGDITWNFEKFLIGRDGAVLKRFAPQITPDAEEVVSAVEAALKA